MRSLPLLWEWQRSDDAFLVLVNGGLAFVRRSMGKNAAPKIK